MTKALLDRLTYHCHIVETGNDSYRVTQATADTKKRIRAHEIERKGLPPSAPRHETTHTTKRKEKRGTVIHSQLLNAGFRPWLNIQSAQWLKFESARTFLVDLSRVEHVAVSKRGQSVVVATSVQEFERSKGQTSV